MAMVSLGVALESNHVVIAESHLDIETSVGLCWRGRFGVSSDTVRVKRNPFVTVTYY